jgi:hypothetical protein
MAERIEFVGNPLPTGLPGFGGGTVSVLVLPGFNTVVAVQQFGPVVDAPTVIPPNPVAPPGSNPEDPTEEVVPPGPAPSPPGTSSNFCRQCVPPEADQYPTPPLLFASAVESGCTDCNGGEIGSINWFATVANESGDGIFLKNGITGLTGKLGSDEWSITTTELKLDGVSGGVSLNESQLALGVGGGVETFYQAGPTIQGPDGKEYSPQDLEVCNGTNTETWKVLAWKP